MITTIRSCPIWENLSLMKYQEVTKSSKNFSAISVYTP